MKPRFAPNSFLAQRAFTLIELLTAMTVLTLMLLMVSQLVNSAVAVMTLSGRHLDADTQARLIFNRMSGDFSRMLKRTDVDYSTFKQPANLVTGQPANLQAGNDQMAFYSETHGYFSGATQPPSTGKADVSLVAYMIANDAVTGFPNLQRLGKGLGWEPDSSGSSSWGNVSYLPITLTSANKWPNLFVADPDYRSIGDLVFRMEYTYLLKPTPAQTSPAAAALPARLTITPYNSTTGHTSVNGFRDVAAIVVTLAMLDNSGRTLVHDYTTLKSNTIFKDAVDGAVPSTVWNAAINSPTFAATAGIPPAAASYVRVYQRYFYLDSPQ